MIYITSEMVEVSYENFRNSISYNTKENVSNLRLKRSKPIVK